MSQEDKLEIDELQSQDELIQDINSCGNCGRRIQAQQKYLEIYNTRRKNYEHYHESYLGCYESTRESGRRVISDRWQKNVSWDQYDVTGSVTVSTGWQL
jgi:hypothetical protein